MNECKETAECRNARAKRPTFFSSGLVRDGEPEVERCQGSGVFLVLVLVHTPSGEIQAQ